MSPAREAAEFFAVRGDELRPVGGDDAGASLGEFLLGPLQAQLDFGFGHGSSDVPVNEGAATAVQNAAEVIEGAVQVQAGNSDVPRRRWSPRGVAATALQ